jgi:very-short-patch-repair endonuclease
MSDEDDETRFSHTREKTEFARKLRRNVSDTERKLWPYLRSGQLGAPFRRQHWIAGHFADYCCVPLMLVIEIDGPTHDRARDFARDFRMSKLGFDVLRFSVQEIDENLEGVVSTIYDAVQLRLQEREASKRGNKTPS